jgi:glycosyltransferase involved in cell wall biosynthesis
MRILQLIDSLEAGGAERMAVNYANALTQQIECSGLVCTRKEGALKNQLDSKVAYLFLDKKHTLDFRAVWRLRTYVIENKIEWVQVHSTSFFMAILLKFICPFLQLIWHDHYGDSEFLASRSKYLYRLGLPFYEGVISVNQKLKNWTIQTFNFKNVIYLPNFSTVSNSTLATTILQGAAGKRILILANLRSQKNHFLVIQLAIRIKISHPDWTFHLVGKDFKDEYATQINQAIKQHNLGETIFMYGSKEDVPNILSQSTIGILTSASEGLPLALLEYGMAKIPVVVTNVGEMPAIVENDINGYVVPVEEQLFYEKLVILMEDESKQAIFAERLFMTVVDKFGENQIIQSYLNWVTTQCK